MCGIRNARLAQSLQLGIDTPEQCQQHLLQEIRYKIYARSRKSYPLIFLVSAFFPICHAGIDTNAVVRLQAEVVPPGSAVEVVVAVPGVQERGHWEANAQRWELPRKHCTKLEDSKRTFRLCSDFLREGF